MLFFFMGFFIKISEIHLSKKLYKYELLRNLIRKSYIQINCKLKTGFENREKDAQDFNC